MQRELVERAQTGDHDAFSVLVRGSFPRLHAVARLILRDPDRAQDAVQEALVLAWRHVRALRDADAWDAWLNRPSDHATDVAERDRLGRALGRLPLDQRAVMVLHFYLDLTLVETAETLGLPIGTAKSRLHRGLAALRDVVSDDPPAPLSLVGERSA
jgi:RNA polymerase sigma-70 factor, ECF subfamily